MATLAAAVHKEMGYQIIISTIEKTNKQGVLFVVVVVVAGLPSIPLDVPLGPEVASAPLPLPLEDGAAC